MITLIKIDTKNLNKIYRPLKQVSPNIFQMYEWVRNCKRHLVRQRRILYYSTFL